MNRFAKEHLYERGFIRIPFEWVKRKPRLRITLIIALLFVLGVLYIQYDLRASKVNPVDVQSTGSENKHLSVVSIRPQGRTAVPRKITMTFSDPVDPHVIEHYFYISPEVSGKLVKGRDSNTVEFIPDVPFEKSVNYSIQILFGMTSSNNKLLLATQFGDFSTELADNSVQFVKDNVYGRVLSFPANKEFSLNIEKSKDIDYARVSLYRSTQANLLNFMVYENKLTDAKYKSYQELFKTNYIDHASSSQIEALIVAKDKQEKKFQLPPGLYYFEATDSYSDAKLGSAFIIVNSVGVLARQDDKKIVLSSFDVATNKLLSVPSTVGFYNLENGPNQIAVHTYSEIEDQFYMNFSQRVDAIIGTVRDETVFVPLKVPNSFADIKVNADLDTSYQIMVYTDRPIYKPGDVVNFKGVVRTDSDSLYSIPPMGTPIKIWVGYGENPEILQNLTTDASGVISGQFKAPQVATADGSNTTKFLYVSADSDSQDYSPTYAYFDVVSYVKPAFELKTSVNKGEIIRNEQMKFTITGNYFDQRPFANQDIQYSIYTEEFYESERTVYNANFNVTGVGGMCGGGLSAFEEYYGEALESEKTVRLDSQGKAEIMFSLPANIAKSQTINFVAKRKDGQNEIISAAKVIVHGAEQNIFFMPSARNYAIGEEIVAPFYVETLDGQKIGNKQFIYKLVETDYGNSKSSTTESTFASGNVTTDSNGRGIVVLKVPSNKDKKTSGFYKYLVIEGKDNQGNLVQVSKYISIVDKSILQQNQLSYWERSSLDQTYLNISSNQNSYKVGEKILLDVISPKDLDVLLSLERGRVYTPRILHLKKGKNTVDIMVDNELSPSITAVFSFFADGDYYTEGVALNIPAMHKLLNVQVQPDKVRYNADDTANLTITTTDAFNTPVKADFSLSVVDKAIYAMRKNATPPVHSTFYYFRPRSTNASSSLTWVGTYDYGGRGGGGGGGSLLGNTVDTLYWNPNLSTNASGEVTVPIPLKGNATIWQAQVIAATDKTDLGQATAEFTSVK